MDKKQQKIASIVAALLVLFSAAMDPKISAGLAVIGLLFLGFYEKSSPKQDSDLADPLNPEQIARRRANLDKIMELAKANPRLTNNDVQKVLKVSDATATRYLQYLEDLGKLVQMGERGQQVYYKIREN